MCGVDFTGDDAHPTVPECCSNGPVRGAKPDCDNKYMGQGPAFESMVDFMRDEALWIRKYLDSWWIATENNFPSLTSLDEELAATRDTLSDDMNTNCLYPEGQCDDLTEDSPCFYATGALITNSLKEVVPQFCLNKHRPISEQRPNNMSLTEWQWASVISLENPASSSTLEEYTAERVLHPQWRIETGDQDYTYHVSPDNEPWANSCAWTAEGEETSTWSADFIGGESAVQNVIIYLMEGE